MELRIALAGNPNCGKTNALAPVSALNSVVSVSYTHLIFHPREKAILNKMSNALRVSYTALVIRLRDLDMLSRHNVSEYIHNELGLGGDI